MQKRPRPAHFGAGLRLGAEQHPGPAPGPGSGLVRVRSCSPEASCPAALSQCRDSHLRLLGNFLRGLPTSLACGAPAARSPRSTRRGPGRSSRRPWRGPRAGRDWQLPRGLGEVSVSGPCSSSSHAVEGAHRVVFEGAARRALAPSARPEGLVRASPRAAPIGQRARGGDAAPEGQGALCRLQDPASHGWCCGLRRTGESCRPSSGMDTTMLFLRAPCGRSALDRNSGDRGSP